MTASFQVIESFEDRSLRGTLKEKVSQRKFWVNADGPATQYEVAAADGIPRVGDPFRGPGNFLDSTVYCDSVDVKQRNESRRMWVVICGYTNILPQASGTNGLSGSGFGGGSGNNPIQQHQSPLLKPATVRWETRHMNVTVWQDPDGNALTNSAEDPYESGLDTELEVLVLAVSRAEATFSAVGARNYAGAVNSVPWLGFEQYTVKCSKFAGNAVYENGLYYWQVDYEFEFAPPGRDWRATALDQGYHYYEDPNDPATRHKFVDRRNGSFAPIKGLLDGLGGRLGGPAGPKGSTPVFRKFLLRKTQDFFLLNLFPPGGGN